MATRASLTAGALALGLLVSACADDGPILDEWGRPTLDPSGWTEGSGGKEDALGGNPGLPTSVDSSSTAVWEVTNQWADTHTPAAMEAGVAWGANSGLTWDEKYRKWIAAMERTECEDCWGDTFQVITPYGKTLPAPSLECAEMAMFLRITFASWYHLPWFMEGTIDGERVFFGHFGIRTANGRWRNTAYYKNAYPDYSYLADEIADGSATWPSHTGLRNRKLYGSYDDDQPQIGEDAHSGAYFDELFLNKRVGHFLMIQLVYFGSINLADPANMYHLAPAATHPGDVLVKRYGSTGIGHTLIVKKRTSFPDAEEDGEAVPQFELELASGSMPRRQPLWDSSTTSKHALVASAGGGPGYSAYGGGIKRWRAARSVGGKWTNSVMPADSDNWVRSTDHDAVEARTEAFERYLVELSAEEKFEALLQAVEAERAWLRDHPSSCAARTRREESFAELYELGPDLGMTSAEIDAEHRILDDYVFSELTYDQSKTCCWNSTNRQMYDVIMAQALAASEDEESGTCQPAPVFRARDDDGDGYDLYRAFAEAQGNASHWRAWSADESCPQASVDEDTEAAQRIATPMCEALDL